MRLLCQWLYGKMVDWTYMSMDWSMICDEKRPHWSGHIGYHCTVVRGSMFIYVPNQGAPVLFTMRLITSTVYHSW
jgi:hypothetical protein